MWYVHMTTFGNGQQNLAIITIQYQVELLKNLPYQDHLMKNKYQIITHHHLSWEVVR